MMNRSEQFSFANEIEERGTLKQSSASLQRIVDDP